MNDEELKEKNKILHDNIDKWDNFSMTIKGWAITAWSAIMVFIFIELKDERVYMIPFFLIITFWILDGLFKQFQRYNIVQSNLIEDMLRNQDNITDISAVKRYLWIYKSQNKLDKKIDKRYKKIDKTDIKLSSNEEENKLNLIKELKEELKNPTWNKLIKNPYFMIKYHKKVNILACLSVRMVSTIYLMLLIITSFIIYILADALIFFSLIIIFSIILIVSWLGSWKMII